MYNDSMFDARRLLAGIVIVIIYTIMHWYDSRGYAGDALEWKVLHEKWGTDDNRSWIEQDVLLYSELPVEQACVKATLTEIYEANNGAERDDFRMNIFFSCLDERNVPFATADFKYGKPRMWVNKYMYNEDGSLVETGYTETY